MLVRCVTNSITQVASRTPLDQDLRQWIGSSSDLPDVSAGALYTVYAVQIKIDVNYLTSYCIADNSYDNYGPLCYPTSYASFFFDVIDRRTSSCWTCAFQQDLSKSKRGTRILITFKEWVDEKNFYENLVEGSPREVGIFKQYKALMDMEFPSPYVKDQAELIEDNWLYCPKCCEAWQSDVILGMVDCPQCSSRLLDPRYSPVNV